MMNGHRQSDGRIVPEKSANKPFVEGGAEGMEGRRSAKGNGRQSRMHRTLRRETHGIGAAEHTSDRWMDARHRSLHWLIVITRGKSRMRQYRTSGSVRGVARKGHPYLDSVTRISARRLALKGQHLRRRRRGAAFVRPLHDSGCETRHATSVTYRVACRPGGRVSCSESAWHLA